MFTGRLTHMATLVPRCGSSSSSAVAAASWRCRGRLPCVVCTQSMWCCARRAYVAAATTPRLQHKHDMLHSNTAATAAATTTLLHAAATAAVSQPHEMTTVTTTTTTATPSTKTQVATPQRRQRRRQAQRTHRQGSKRSKRSSSGSSPLAAQQQQHDKLEEMRRATTQITDVDMNGDELAGGGGDADESGEHDDDDEREHDVTSSGAVATTAVAYAQQQQQQSPQQQQSQADDDDETNKKKSGSNGEDGDGDSSSSNGSSSGDRKVGGFVVYDDEKLTATLRAPLDVMIEERGLRPVRRDMYQLVDYAALERASKIEDTKVAQYALHTMHDISDTITRSLRAYTNFFIFAANRYHMQLAYIIRELENEHRSMMPGSALYLRIVSTRAQDNNNNSSSSSDSNGGDTKSFRDSRLHADVHAGVLRVLREFVVDYIEPFPGEVACDVTHYAHYMPLLLASRRNVAQVVQDMSDYVRDGALAAEGHPGVLTSKKELRPLSVDVVAADVATRIRDEVLLPLLQKQQHEHVTREDGHCRCDEVRVCMGIAPTPMLAKMACDAEVALLLRRCREKSSHSYSSNKADDTTTLVRVRSLQRHVATARDRRRFMSHFKVSQIPCVTPAFARLLRDVFGVETCAQIVEKRHLLSFALSRETFAVCFAMAYGCMRFPEEKRVQLLNTHTLVVHDALLDAFATNIIAIADESRRGLCGNPLPPLRRNYIPLRGDSVAMRHVYGRLADDDNFVALCLYLCRLSVTRLRSYSFIASAIGITLTGGARGAYHETVAIPSTQDMDVILAHMEPLARQVAPHRQRGGFMEKEAMCHVVVSLYRLSTKSLVPQRCQDEMHALRNAYFDARELFTRSPYYIAFSQNRSVEEVKREMVVPMQLPSIKGLRRAQIVRNILTL